MAYSHYATVTIDNTKVGGSANHTNFPVLFTGTFDGTGGEPDLRTTGNGGNVQDANGYDIGFFSDSELTTQLDHELIYHTATTGAVQFWVRVPTVDFDDDTVFYIAYGDSGISADQSVDTTWTSDYKLVAHLNTALTDSSQSGVTLTNVTTTDTAGKINRARAFDGASYVWAADSDDWSPGSGDFHVSAWVKFINTTSTRGVYGQYVDGTNYSAMFTTSSTLQWGQYVSGDEGPSPNSQSTTTFSNDTWYLVAFSRIGTAWELSMNGVSEDTDTLSDTLSNLAAQLRIGQATTSTMYGDIEEFRFMKGTGRNIGWMLTEYNNQNSPSTFLTVGSETEVSTEITGGNLTAYSSQEIMNILNSSTGMTVQEIANSYNSSGEHQYTFQEVLNIKASRAEHSMSEQEALFNNLKTPLSLTGNHTDYSVQDLLNLAYLNSIDLAGVFGE